MSRLHPLQAKVGERVRIFFGVGGPNCTSSFHVIREIFDKVYALGGLETAPLEGIPGKYTLVDHTSRERSADYLAF